MAELHRTTMTPTKLELLTAWVPRQPWYAGDDPEPQLTKVGGYRLDDPAGEVGIEFMVVAVGSGAEATYHQVPLTYRGQPLEGAEHALVGTAEHGVLGRRWIYDGAHDPVLTAQLLALLQAHAEPQAQSTSHTPDPSVVAHANGSGLLRARTSRVLTGESSTSIMVETVDALGEPTPPVVITVVRTLQDGDHAGAGPGSAGDARSVGHVTGPWTTLDGATARGHLAFAEVAHD